MIIYFSGTGNSAMVARRLRQQLFAADTAAAAPAADDAGADTPETADAARLYELSADRLLYPHRQMLTARPGEPVVWVFPIYAWAPPYMVLRFIRKVKFLHGEDARHFMVCTCGDDIGRADDRWREAIGRRQWTPLGAFSVQMPNTYVAMKGFDTDPADVAAAKLAAMPARVAAIADAIRRNYSRSDVVRGSWAWLKTNVAYPWFRAVKMNPARFTVDASRCTRCGLCARSCPMMNITLATPSSAPAAGVWGGGFPAAVTKTPQWGPACTLCLRCYHSCPVHAIDWGAATAAKGQWRLEV